VGLVIGVYSSFPTPIGAVLRIEWGSVSEIVHSFPPDFFSFVGFGFGFLFQFQREGVLPLPPPVRLTFPFLKRPPSEDAEGVSAKSLWRIVTVFFEGTLFLPSCT